MKRAVLTLIPNFARPPLRALFRLPVAFVRAWRAKRSMVPPEAMIFVGSGDFQGIGKEFRNLFIELGNLQPSDRVLEVGCGIGRMAIPLTHYLSKKGAYWGFDPVKLGIEWCQTRISPRFSNFHFKHVDIYNLMYNPEGVIRSHDFSFPYEDEFFDFVFLTSVFTHMLRADVEHYLAEISRVLRTGGTCFTTFHIVNEDSQQLMNSGHSTFHFKYEMDGALTTDETVPETAIAYREGFLRGLFEKCHLVLVEPIHYGAWCGREKFSTWQDVIIARKNNDFGRSLAPSKRD